MTVFQTWVLGGIRFLAIPRGSDFHILDETGAWYGGWLSVENFRAQHKKGCAPALTGVFATLSANTHSEDRQ